MIPLICITALGASLLTFFSGFGLGTILLPVMAVFFPVDVAVALTGVVHFLNNIFKLTLVGRHARLAIVLRFGAPAMLASYVGARLLMGLAHAEPLAQYTIGGHIMTVSPVKLVVAVLMIIFALFELLPRFKSIQFGLKWMPFGGLLSGFFGGLSGHQGALRSMFLIRAGLSKESFIATGVAIACAVDVMRLTVYASQFAAPELRSEAAVLGAATLSAFAGAWLGNRLLKKVTYEALQVVVAITIIIFASLLAAGIV